MSDKLTLHNTLLQFCYPIVHNLALKVPFWPKVATSRPICVRQNLEFHLPGAAATWQFHWDTPNFCIIGCDNTKRTNGKMPNGYFKFKTRIAQTGGPHLLCVLGDCGTFVLRKPYRTFVFLAPPKKMARIQFLYSILASPLFNIKT